MLSFSQHDYATMGASGGVATIEPVRQFGLFLKPFANGSLCLGVVSSYLGCRMHRIETGVESDNFETVRAVCSSGTYTNVYQYPQTRRRDYGTTTDARQRTE